MRYHLANRLFKGVIGWYLGLAVSVTAVQLGIEYSAVSNSIGTEIGYLARSFAPGMAEAMWGFDQTLLASMAKGLTQSAVVTGVRIEGANGELAVDDGAIPAPIRSPGSMFA